MSILEKLGLAQKQKPGAPIIGEKKKKKEAASTLKHNVYIRALIIVGFLGVLIFSVPQASFKEPVSYSIGEPWKADDLTAPFTFPIKKDPEEVEKEKEAIRKSTPPIFHLDQNLSVSVKSKVDSLFRNMQPVLDAYTDWKLSSEKNTGTVRDDSLQFIQKMSSSGINLSDAAWNSFLNDYLQVKSDGGDAGDGVFIGTVLNQQLDKLISELLNDGIINLSKNEISNSEIILRNTETSTERSRNLATVRDLKNAREYIRINLSKRYSDEVASAGVEIFNNAIKPNLKYSSDKSQAEVEEALANISTSKGAVAQGQVIIRKGDLVTKEKYNMLQSLADARSQNASEMERWLRYGGDVLAILAILTIFFFYLYLYRKSIFENNAMLLLVLIAMSIICVSSAVVYGVDNISPYIVPVAIAPIILTIIFDSRVGLVSTITLALLTGLIIGNDFEYAVATTVACSLGLFSVRDIKKRSQFFFTTPGIVFGSYTLVIISFNMTAFEGWSDLLNQLMFVGISAIFILFTYPLILLFEKTFKVTTDFTLIELSDTNLPLLKELMSKAPGTFHHSLQVANLAEAAAGAIGANGLLCRVGALYHDIGKMENPGYFTENQTGSNEHDKLKPRMSALVIKAHVSNGVKLAHEHNLPALLVTFIETHHGTSIIRFFYEKAKEMADEDKDEIREEDFKYDGPLPQTKETGILLLADGVEAASRAMKDPNYPKLETLVNKMVDDRVYEGQLSRTPLTFQDLRVIKETFLNILVGIYHSRVEYPEDKTDGSDKKKNKKRTTQKKPDEHGSNVNEKEKNQEQASQSPENMPHRVDDYYNS